MGDERVSRVHRRMFGQQNERRRACHCFGYVKSVAIDPEFNVTLDTLLIARDTKLTALGRDTFATIITSYQ